MAFLKPPGVCPVNLVTLPGDVRGVKSKAIFLGWFLGSCLKFHHTEPEVGEALPDFNINVLMSQIALNGVPSCALQIWIWKRGQGKKELNQSEIVFVALISPENSLPHSYALPRTL